MRELLKCWDIFRSLTVETIFAELWQMDASGW